MKKNINYEEFINLNYQTIRVVVRKLNDDTVQDFMKQTELRLNSFYEKTKDFKPMRVLTIKEKNEETDEYEEKNIFVQPKLSAKEFEAVMKGIKKLEIVYGYLYDRIYNTNYQTL